MLKDGVLKAITPSRHKVFMPEGNAVKKGGRGTQQASRPAYSLCHKFTQQNNYETLSQHANGGGVRGGEDWERIVRYASFFDGNISGGKMASTRHFFFLTG